MNLASREYILSRIISGQLHCRVENEDLLLKSPTVETIYFADKAYMDTLYKTRFLGFLTQEEVLNMMIDNGLWDIDKEQRLSELGKEIENAKINLYQNLLRPGEQKKDKKRIEELQKELNILLFEKHMFDYVTREGLAALVKLHHLIGRSLYRMDGNKVWEDDEFLYWNSYVLESVVNQYNKAKIEDKVHRELARTEPWRSIWTGNKIESIFGKPMVELNDDQKVLILWSKMYDNIYQNQDCPSDKVVADDDMIDGWLILQRRKREQEQIKKQGEGLVSDKLQDAGEVFVVAKTKEEAAAIDALNTTESKILKRQRMNALKHRGQMKEAEMPDTKREIMFKQHQMLRDRIKGN